MQTNLSDKATLYVTYLQHTITYVHSAFYSSCTQCSDDLYGLLLVCLATDEHQIESACSVSFDDIIFIPHACTTLAMTLAEDVTSELSIYI